MRPFRLLVLGGTGDARELAAQVHRQFGRRVSCVYSIAGRTDTPLLPPVAVRRGGFGGTSGLETYLRTTGCDAVIDATHPFAERISRNAKSACANATVPLIALQRPPSERAPADNWHRVDSITAAAQLLRQRGWRRVFVTTGRTDLEAFAAVPDTFFLVRLFSPVSRPLPTSETKLLIDRGPFAVEDEMALMREHSIQVLIAKDSGGAATRAKLIAARRLSLPVVLLRRPPVTEPTVSDRQAALDWVDQRLRERCNAESRKGVIDPFPPAGH